MQDSESSFFCQPSTASDALSSQIPLDIPSSVYLYYKVCVDGRLCFLKALRPEHLSEQYWHETLRKEYELGVQLTSDYVVRYVRLTDHADECSVLMDYVNGQTLAEVLAVPYSPVLNLFALEGSVASLLVTSVFC